jgi:hypothetical protein
MEGCQVFAASSPTEFNKESFKVNTEYLDFPVEDIISSQADFT